MLVKAYLTVQQANSTRLYAHNNITYLYLCNRKMLAKIPPAPLKFRAPLLLKTSNSSCPKFVKAIPEPSHPVPPTDPDPKRIDPYTAPGPYVGFEAEM